MGHQTSKVCVRRRPARNPDYPSQDNDGHAGNNDEGDDDRDDADGDDEEGDDEDEDDESESTGARKGRKPMSIDFPIV